MLLAARRALPARAEGSYEIPAGAHFNPDKLAKIGDFFKNEIATGKIPGAIVLIQQHGKPVYHEFFGVQDVVGKAPMTDKTIFRLFSMTKADHRAWWRCSCSRKARSSSTIPSRNTFPPLPM